MTVKSIRTTTSYICICIIAVCIIIHQLGPTVSATSTAVALNPVIDTETYEIVSTEQPCTCYTDVVNGHIVVLCDPKPHYEQVCDRGYLDCLKDIGN